MQIVSELEPAPEPPPQEPSKPKWQQKLGPIGTGLAFLLAKAKAVLSFLIPALKFLKLGKVLLTSGSMLLSIAVYSTLFGWKFAVGFVICIFVHEMGHVLAAKAYGLPVSAPVFIPMFGALITMKQAAKSAWISAVIGIGGPIGGTIAALACWAIYSATGSHLYLGLAYTAFFLNLFNMTPMYPLDGGRIVGAISPYLWAVGLVAIVYFFLTGSIHNPLILILLIMSVPRIWTAFKRGTADPEGGEVTTVAQKWGMGAAYLALGGFLLWGMNVTHAISVNEVHPRVQGHVASLSPAPIGQLGRHHVVALVDQVQR